MSANGSGRLNGHRDPAGVWRRLRIGLLVAAGVVLSAACSGGKLAGIEGTGAVAAGPVTGFGSIFVNGVEFSTSATAFDIDGQSGSQLQLRVGQVVDVVGSIDANGTTGKATQVNFKTSVQGPVAAISLANSTVTVLGQRVKVGTGTSFGADAGATPSLAGLTPGTLVAVSGFRNPDGSTLATRLDVKQQVAAYVLTGSVANLDSINRQFALGGAKVDYSSAGFSGFPGNRALQNADVVQVSSAPTAPAGVVSATTIVYIGGVSAPSGDGGEIEGEITRFASAADFDVAGTHVTTSGTTVFLDGNANQLAPGLNVRVQGSFDSTGAVAASQVRFNQPAPLLLRGQVQGVNPAGNTLQLLGNTVTTNADTRFDDQGAVPVSPFNLASVHAGDIVEVRGRSAGANALTASLLTRETNATVELRGTAGGVSVPNLTVLGVTAVTGAGTLYFDAAGLPITGTQFFSLASAAATVDLQGSLGGTSSLQVAQASLVGTAQIDE